MYEDVESGAPKEVTGRQRRGLVWDKDKSSSKVYGAPDMVLVSCAESLKPLSMDENMGMVGSKEDISPTMPIFAGG